MAEHGQTNIFDDVLKDNESFVIVVQEVMDNNGALQKKILREYPSLDHTAMKNLFDHLKDTYLNETFSEHGTYFDITVYTNEDYAAENIYAHTKKYRNKKEWTKTSK
ncbi:MULTISPECIES: hypothetical protein [unclassified Jeotgalicoccus]|uniref:hypothetical protein n=1 Tax=unclassified Jeotgalicoccus TaxID=2630462 RepID=UPI001415007C|nr:MULTISPECIES: hypothetical protein [unclassified Jeotgalicoccus]QQD84221.1 hypothetical protein JEM45_06065 [Jeotgalicoccus sp. ATCC 8456]